MSEELFFKLLPVGGPLIGALVGGALTIIATYCFERQRWHRERQEKLARIKRDAIGAALEWISPMRNAEIRASGLVMSAIRGDFDHERFLKEFPYLLGELVKRDLPGVQMAVLPGSIYERGHRIVRELDDLISLGVRYGSQAKIGKPMHGFQECSNKLDSIRTQISELESDLGEMLIRTFK